MIGISLEGRNRQAARMKNLKNEAVIKGNHGVADFVRPTNKTRKTLMQIILYGLTLLKGRFEDTNKMFEPPTKFNFRVHQKMQNNGLKKLRMI